MKKIQKNAARFDNLKQDFLDNKKYSGTAEATLNGYRYDITQFLKFLSDEQLAVNEAGFKRYVIHLTDSGMTANSVSHYIRSVKVFLYWCMEQDEIAPFKIKMVKAQETIKDVYTQEELCALIQPPKREDSFVIWRSWAIINFILGTAAREATVVKCRSTLPFYSNSTSSCNSNSVELHIANCCFNVPLISCLAIKKALLLNTLH